MRTIAIMLAIAAAIAMSGCPKRTPLPSADQAQAPAFRYTIVWSNGYQYMAVDADVQVRSEDIVVFPKVVRDGPRGVQPGVKVTDLPLRPRKPRLR